MHLVHPPDPVGVPVVAEIPECLHPLIPRPDMQLHALQRQREPQPPQPSPDALRHPAFAIQAPRRTSQTAPSIAAQGNRPSQTASHTATAVWPVTMYATTAHARKGHAHTAAIPYRVAIPAHAANTHTRAFAHSTCHAYACIAPPSCAYARVQKPRRVAAISAIAVKGMHASAYAGCISRLLAPKVSRPSRRLRTALPFRKPAHSAARHVRTRRRPPAT